MVDYLCVFLWASFTASIPLIYVLRGYDIGDEDKYGTRCLRAKMEFQTRFLSSIVSSSCNSVEWVFSS